jgi:Domain of unknown function (DUF1830)
MTQLLSSPTPASKSRIFCCYANFSNQVQIARISEIANWYFERVVFPGQRLLFEAPSHAQLEIHTGSMASAIFSDTIACHSLRVQEVDGGLLDASAQSTKSPTLVNPPVNAVMKVQL